MTLPGFTAEDSLSSVGSRYKTVGTTKASRVEVIPQYCFTNPGGYTTCCYCYPGIPCYCFHIHRHVLE